MFKFYSLGCFALQFNCQIVRLKRTINGYPLSKHSKYFKNQQNGYFEIKHAYRMTVYKINVHVVP